MKIELWADDAVSLEGRQREVVIRRIHFALARFADRIARVNVRLTDENGPRGGIDHRCLVEVDLRPGPKLYVEAQGVDAEVSAAIASRRAARRVRDELSRRRLFGRRQRTVRVTPPDGVPDVPGN
mgnify:CR=1 FL=1